MCDSRSVRKVFISLRLLLLRYESHIQNPTFPILFIFFHSETKDTSKLNQKRKTHHILFHSETKDTSYTPTIPFMSFNIIQFESGKYLFSQWFISFHLFYWYPNMCWKPKLYPSYSLSFTLKRKTLLFTSFSHICVLFSVS